MKYRLRALNTKGSEKIFNTGKVGCDFYIEGLVALKDEGLNKRTHIQYKVSSTGAQILEIQGDNLIVRIGGTSFTVRNGKVLTTPLKG